MTLQVTEVLHEAYLRLVGQTRTSWQNRAHFFAVSARLMRRVLLDHARNRGRQKRGGGARLLDLDDLQVGRDDSGNDPDLIALSQALDRLEAIDRTAASIVELTM